MKSECKLVYVIEDYDDSGNPVNDEFRISVKCDDLGQWSSGYYEDRNRSMMKSINFRIGRNYLNSCRGELRYVDYKGIRYEIKQVLKDNQRKLKCILDCEEFIV
ncbi:hypothetical protein B5F09_06660 [Erysipelatoclostridium sp. An173]|uniref:hypothetical protein n=1 Tax=Erysipelatoclostridium sp. An173 TaxID=1965571 RepID=UPI000B38C15F|nr:hypothetical protein [Erysipelatoclostridium sp. An173]OUP77235.1 hypothetical protein B5F09_06660 [Erysipelatoclostridium sp. An173]